MFLWHQDVCFWNQQRAYLYVCLVQDTTILLTSKQTDLSSFLGDVLNLSFGKNVMRKKKISKKHLSLLLYKTLVSSVVWLLLQSIEQYFPVDRGLFSLVFGKQEEKRSDGSAYKQLRRMLKKVHLGPWQRSLFFSSAEYLGKEASAEYLGKEASAR